MRALVRVIVALLVIVGIGALARVAADLFINGLGDQQGRDGRVLDVREHRVGEHAQVGHAEQHVELVRGGAGGEPHHRPAEHQRQPGTLFAGL